MNDLFENDDLSWRAQGACVGSDPDMWFTKSAGMLARARNVCRECPVLRQCRSYALSHAEYGFWGGLTEAERGGRQVRVDTLQSHG